MFSCFIWRWLFSNLYLLLPILQDFIDAIEVLPEADSPSYFGLPENIDRSSQRMASSSVITQLKILKRADTRAAKFDREVWAAELNPILTLWKKLNTVYGYWITLNTST